MALSSSLDIRAAITYFGEGAELRFDSRDDLGLAIQAGRDAVNGGASWADVRATRGDFGLIESLYSQNVTIPPPPDPPVEVDDSSGGADPDGPVAPEPLSKAAVSTFIQIQGRTVQRSDLKDAFVAMGHDPDTATEMSNDVGVTEFNGDEGFGALQDAFPPDVFANIVHDTGFDKFDSIYNLEDVHAGIYYNEATGIFPGSNVSVDNFSADEIFGGDQSKLNAWLSSTDTRSGDGDMVRSFNGELVPRGAIRRSAGATRDSPWYLEQQDVDGNGVLDQADSLQYARNLAASDGVMEPSRDQVISYLNDSGTNVQEWINMGYNGFFSIKRSKEEIGNLLRESYPGFQTAMDDFRVNGSYDKNFDFDGDGKIDFSDFTIFAGMGNTGDQNGDGVITAADVSQGPSDEDLAISDRMGAGDYVGAPDVVTSGGVSDQKNNRAWFTRFRDHEGTGANAVIQTGRIGGGEEGPSLMEDLVSYIGGHQTNGQTDNDIRSSLIGAGLNDEQILQAFNAIHLNGITTASDVGGHYRLRTPSEMFSEDLEAVRSQPVRPIGLPGIGNLQAREVSLDRPDEPEKSETQTALDQRVTDLTAAGEVAKKEVHPSVPRDAFASAQSGLSGKSRSELDTLAQTLGVKNTDRMSDSGLQFTLASRQASDPKAVFGEDAPRQTPTAPVEGSSAS